MDTPPRGMTPEEFEEERAASLESLDLAPHVAAEAAKERERKTSQPDEEAVRRKARGAKIDMRPKEKRLGAICDDPVDTSTWGLEPDRD
jgi:hypothetical protein